MTEEKKQTKWWAFPPPFKSDRIEDKLREAMKVLFPISASSNLSEDERAEMDYDAGELAHAARELLTIFDSREHESRSRAAIDQALQLAKKNGMDVSKS